MRLGPKIQRFRAEDSWQFMAQGGHGTAMALVEASRELGVKRTHRVSKGQTSA